MATVLITGSNRGIGLALTHHYVERGDHVLAICRKTSGALDASGAEVFAGFDVTDDAIVKTLAAALGDRAIDIAILGAGVLSAEALPQVDYNAMRRQFEVNTLGPLRTVEAILNNLHEGSKIGITTSRMGSIADNTSGGMFGYRASKAAVNAIGRSLAHNLRERGIAVQLLHPGFVRTEMTGGNGLIDADESARALIACIDELTLESTGTFRHQNGEMLPW